MADSRAIPAPAGTGVVANEQKSAIPSGGSATDYNVKMTEFIVAFQKKFNALMNQAQVEEMFNPLRDFGTKKDGKTSVGKRVLTFFGRKEWTVSCIQPEDAVEHALKRDRYKRTTDRFLKKFYPEKLSGLAVSRAPEFIVRTVRSFILNTIHHIHEKEKRITFLRIARRICLYVLVESDGWMEDKSFLSTILSELSDDFLPDNDSHDLRFCLLFQNLVDKLQDDIHCLVNESITTALPDSLKKLRDVGKDLEHDLRKLLLQHLTTRILPDDFFDDDAMVALFQRKTLTYQEFKKNRIINGDYKDFVDSEALFKIIKYNFFAFARKELRTKVIESAVQESLAGIDTLSEMLSSPELEREKKEEERLLIAPSNPSNQLYLDEKAPQDSLVPPVNQVGSLAMMTGDNLTVVQSLSQQTVGMTGEYYKSVDEFVSKHEWVLAALPKYFSKIYHSDAKSQYSPEVRKYVSDYVRIFEVGFELLEDIINFQGSVQDTLGFHKEGGTLLTAGLRLANLYMSSLEMFNEIEVFTERLKHLSKLLMLNIKQPIDRFKNINQAIGTSTDIHDILEQRATPALREMQAASSVESLQRSARDAVRHAVSLTVRSIVLRRDRSHRAIKDFGVSPVADYLGPIAVTIGAMAKREKQNQRFLQDANRQFSNALPRPALEMSGDRGRRLLLPSASIPLSQPASVVAQRKLDITLSEADILGAEIRACPGLTLEELTRQSFSVTSATGEATFHFQEQKITLDSRAKRVVDSLRKRNFNNPSRAGNAHPSVDLLVQRIDHLRAELRASNQKKMALMWEREVKRQEYTKLDKHVRPTLNRDEDLSAKFYKRWYLLALSIVGIPFLIGAVVYRLYHRASIKSDQDAYQNFDVTQLNPVRAQLADINQRIDTIDQEIKRRSDEIAALEQQASQPKASKSKRQKPLELKTPASAPPPLNATSHGFFAAGNGGNAYPLPVVEAKENKHEIISGEENEKRPISIDTLATQIRGRLTEEQVQSLFGSSQEYMPNILDPILDDVVAQDCQYLEFLQSNPGVRNKIFSILLTDLLMEAKELRVAPYVRELVISPKVDKSKLLKTDDDQLKIIFQKEFNSPLPSSCLSKIKNNEVRQYIVLAAIREIQKMRDQQQANAAPSMRRGR